LEAGGKKVIHEESAVADMRKKQEWGMILLKKKKLRGNRSRTQKKKEGKEVV